MLNICLWHSVFSSRGEMWEQCSKSSGGVSLECILKPACPEDLWQETFRGLYVCWERAGPWVLQRLVELVVFKSVFPAGCPVSLRQGLGLTPLSFLSALRVAISQFLLS